MLSGQFHVIVARLACRPLPPLPRSDDGSDASRSVISLVLFIHLFCVAVVLSSNFRRSPLQARLVSMFAPYTQLLHFDPDFTPYYYTLGRASDDDTWLAIDLYADAKQPVAAQPLVKTVQAARGGTSTGSAIGGGACNSAQMVAANADPESENDDITSEIARPVGAWLIRQTNNGRAVVRCVRRMSQPFDLAIAQSRLSARSADRCRVRRDAVRSRRVDRRRRHSASAESAFPGPKPPRGRPPRHPAPGPATAAQ